MPTIHLFLTDLHVLIQWLDSEDVLFDTIQARYITPPENVDVLDLKPGDHCRALYESRHYSVNVLAVGKHEIRGANS